MDNIKKIEVLRKFFTVSNAAFTFAETLSNAFGAARVHDHNFTNMRTLHSIALSELEKDNPSLEYMDKLLEQMEVQADINKKIDENQD